MKVIADINISVLVVSGLVSRGHDAQRSDAFLPATAMDVEIAAVAARLGAVVLTRDQDFSALLAMSQAKAPSVINLRHQRTDWQFLVNLMDQVLTQHEGALLRGAIVSVAPAEYWLPAF